MEELFSDKELREWILYKEKPLEEDLRRLVEIPSVAQSGTGETPYGKACKDVLLEIEKIAQRLGFETENHNNRLMSIFYGKGEQEIGIWGHLDVVPEGEGWIYPPFECTKRQGFFIGRGTQDNKGPAVAVLYAMAFLKEKGYQPPVKFRQILGCKEEQGMEDVEYYLSHFSAPDFSFVSDCSFPVCCGEKGILNLTIRSGKMPDILKDIHGGTASNAIPAMAEAVAGEEHFQAEGIAGHAAFPEEGKSAFGILCRKLSAVKELKDEPGLKLVQILGSDGYGIGAGIACQDEKSGKLTCNLGTLRLKDKRVEGQIDIRYPVSVKGDHILEKFAKFLGQYGYEIIKKKDSPPYYLPPEDLMVKCLMDTYRGVTGDTDARPYIMGGGTYARKIPRAVGFGPGLPADLSPLHMPEGHGNCHSADEAQSVANLQKARLGEVLR